MSVNGLDNPQVKEAHEGAAAEPGGWFLLKYASRDEIELLGRGNGGIVEIRNTIASYDETSPLYGFLRYRRRNVIIKFLPDGCSRLIQARVSVHFNAVCERFSPYDTTFEITDAKELKDTKLSAACSLHAASGSTSSSTSSLRRRRLMEIAEEEEEEQRAAKRQSVVEEERPSPRSGSPSRGLPASPVSAPPITLNFGLASSPESTKFSSSTDPPTFVGVDRPTSPTASVEGERRLSSQTARSDLYTSYSNYSSYGRPKVKLGPRPSLDSRPRTAGNYRPISALPAGLKLSRKAKSREKNELDGPIQEDPTDASTTTIAIPQVPLTPKDELTRPHTSGGRPSTSSAVSVRSLNITSPRTASVKDNKMSPEKARLLKAMQLREKKLKAAAAAAPPSPSPEVAPAPTVVEPVEEDVAAEEEAEHEDEVPDDAKDANAESDNRLSMSKADSGIAIDLPSPSATDVASEDTQTDSHPASPVAAPSEVEMSTKASSLSESTDETVHVADEKGVEDVGQPNANEDAAPGMDEGEERPADVVETALIAGEQPTTEEQPTVEAHEETEEEASNDDVAEETEPTNDSQESNINTPATPVSKLIALPTSKFSTRVSDVEESQSAGMEPSVTESTTLEGSPVSPTWKIPVSRFSTHEPTTPVRGGLAIAVTRAEEPDTNDLAYERDPFITAPESDAVSTTTSDWSRRKPSIEPIRTDIDSHEDPDAHLSDDDELMDELQSATLQEAKHLTVSKSPATPVFPALAKTFPASPRTSPNFRAASNPALRGPLLAPSDVTQSSARSVSSGAAFLHKIAQQQSQTLVPKTGKIGSSISQRIKALEKLSNSNNSSTDSLHVPPRNAPSSTFFSVRKAATVRESSRSPSVLDRASMLSPSPTDSRDHSPEFHRDPTDRERSGSVASRLSMFEAHGSQPGQPHGSPSAPQSRGRTESIQVTARIIRDPTNPYPQVPESQKGQSEYPPMDLKQSPLFVDVTRAQLPAPPAPEVLPTPDAPKETIQERRKSRDKRASIDTQRGIDTDKGRRSSLTIVRDFIRDRRNSLVKSPNPENLAAPSPNPPSRSSSRPPSTHQNAFSPRRLSISSRRSSTSKDRDATDAMSPTLTEASVSGDEKSTNDKKMNRATRFIRRLSASLSSGRKNMTPNISPTVAEEEPADIAASNAVESRPTSTQPSILAYMGDVNVQFPDNLLWKRRSMCLDSQGFLIISAIQGHVDKHVGAGVKRYHLSEFRHPHIPDVEVQELPNSVVLDFVDGSGLQIACEDRAGQLSVLHILQGAHQSHTSFGQ